MLEATFPTCSIFQLPDERVCQNKSRLLDLTSGEANREGTGKGRKWQLIAGSRAEGLALVDRWGHERADVDYMYLHGCELGVCVPPEHLTTPSISSDGHQSNNCLQYDPKDCPPTYTRLRVTDTQAIMAHHCVNIDCVLEGDGQHWLLPTRLNEAIQRDLNQTRTNPDHQSTSINGPAGQAWGGLADMVPTLVADNPHPAIENYINRPRSTEWPSQDQLQQIRRLPMIFVLVGDKESPRKDQETRISLSAAELVLISTLPNHVKQGYIAFKYVLRYFLTINRKQTKSDDGRSKVGSYHLKTIFLYHLDKTPPSMIKSSYGLMMDLLSKSIDYLKSMKLPHYFLPECDLLATVGHDEQQIALQSINDILLDPITAVLKCPSAATEIYGDILPDNLVSTFHHVSKDPCSERSWGDLLLLFSRLDQWRQCQYHRQLEFDGREGLYRVSGRPEPRRLVPDILKQTKHRW